MTDDYNFEVHCDASDAGGLHAKTNSVSIRVGQRLGRNGIGEIWDSIMILCQETEHGSLSAKVIVCHPDWDQYLQIAHVQSRATGLNSSTPALDLDLKPVQV